MASCHAAPSLDTPRSLVYDVWMRDRRFVPFRTSFRAISQSCLLAIAMGCSSGEEGASQDDGASDAESVDEVALDSPDPASPGAGASDDERVVGGDSADGVEDVRDPLDAPDDVAAPPADAEVTASGLATRVLVEGQGADRPSATDTVRVHYVGWQTNGQRFDSSIERGEPSEFPLNGVIAGWTEGLQLMVEGEKRRLWVPEDLAYQGRREPSGMLVFDVELIAILGE